MIEKKMDCASQGSKNGSLWRQPSQARQPGEAERGWSLSRFDILRIGTKLSGELHIYEFL